MGKQTYLSEKIFPFQLTFNIYTSIAELLQLFVPPLVPIMETIALVLNINTATYIAVCGKL